MLRVGYGISGTNILSVGRGVSVSGGGGEVCTPVDQILGSVAPGSTFTHPADGVVAFDLAVSGGSAQSNVLFRIQDSTHLWRLRLWESGAADLIERAGGDFTRGSAAAGTTTGSHRLAIVMDGATISIYLDGAPIISYDSATAYQAETDGEISSVTTGAAISNLKTWTLACRGEEGV